MIKVTVFTPTFNRAHVLKRCYLSILDQHRDDIEWLIIDDGSTDDTANIVKGFKNENKLKIKYIYQDNSGKQAAWNKAVENASGDYFIGVDSDDILVSDSISQLLEVSTVFADNSIIGIRAISMNSEKMKPDSLYLYGHNSKSSWFDEFRSGLRGERIDFFKTKILKKYLYPINENIKFIPEIWFYSTVSKDYCFYYSSIHVGVFFDDDQTNRLSKSSIKKHATGHYISRKALLENIPLKIWLSRPLDFLKSVLRINQALVMMDAEYIDHNRSSLLVRMVTLPGVIVRKIKR
ncbi:glycosyltransferase family 2 protein [Yersinia enterocolitica]|uniref:glycosyltransferase family 2 protein n=1 Tax=Yersinia enterocolitica TaxID=630 RepID=UPI0005E62A3F|nr:glycosyltransferase family A protein [Yersinia enterocolitica]ELI8169996.1 glycosyltransferase family 2 protein [Yersinia enterocolitica]ELW7387372.1 glycosyltransferase family 2 protein [Yersinia enterocolitica]CFB68809.1 WbcL protein [Yersinia enterocolitica]HDL6595188.1 glycosyltransferase family 2 protein [Yersinia enterocolitica]HDL7335094.1 glycosyltransferase family 2 protein [Yersinia enterocolitica]